MGLTYVDIILENTVDTVLAKQGNIPSKKVRKMKVTALVDSGAMTLAINEKIAKKLGLEIIEQTEVTLADGSYRKCDYVGPVIIRFENRTACCRAIVVPGADEVLLGVIPIEEMDVIIDPRTQQLAVHPDRPLMAGMKLK
jgi:clan AA aspartic protease